MIFMFSLSIFSVINCLTLLENTKNFLKCNINMLKTVLLDFPNFIRAVCDSSMHSLNRN